MVSSKEEEETYFPRGGYVDGNDRTLKRKGTFVFDKRITEKKAKKHPGRRERERMKQTRTEDYVSLPSAESKNVQYLKYPVPEGMLLMCCIVGVHPNSLSVKLPNRISAKIYGKDVSQPFNRLLNDGKKDNKLERLFTIGSCYPCKRISSTNSHEVCVSTDPAVVNSDLTFIQICKGMLIIGAVLSENDHGYTIFTGIPGVIAFLPHENTNFLTEQKNNNKPLVPGQLVWCKVTKCKINNQTNIIEVTAQPKAITREVTSTISPEMLMPGTAFKATVDEVMQGAIYIKLNNSDFGGFIMQSHLPSSKLSDYRPGSEVSVCVLYKYPYNGLAAYSMIIKPHTELKKEIEDGTLLERAKIVEINARGVLLELKHDGKTFKGMITHRRLTNFKNFQEKVDSFPIGNHISVRVLGFDYIEPFYSCSNEDDIIHEEILALGNIQVGQSVLVQIVEKNQQGYVGKVGKLRAFIPVEHITDEPGSSHLKIGSKKEGRVLKIQENLNTAVITLKPLLISGAVLKDLNNVSQGEVYHGTVVAVYDSGIKVAFFNNISANINCTNLIKDYKQYELGETVKCYVSCFLKGVPKFSLLKSVDQSNLSIGKQYTLVVTYIKKEGIICLGNEKKETFKADLPLHHLSDHPELWRFLITKIKLGDVLSNAYLFNYCNGRAVFSLRESVRNFFKGNKSVVSKGVEALVRDMILPCNVSISSSIMKVSVPVPSFNREILFNLEDNKNYLSSQYATVFYYDNQPISLQVKQYDNISCNIELYRNKQTYPDEKWAVDNIKNFLETVSPFQQFKLGETLKVTIQSVDKCSKAVVGVTDAGKQVHIHSKEHLQIKSKLNVVVIFDDVLRNLVHSVPSSQIESDGDIGNEELCDENKQHEEVDILFANSLLMVGWIQRIKKIAYIPSKGVLNSVKPNLFAEGIHRIKVLCSEDRFCIGYPLNIKMFTLSMPKHIISEGNKLLPFKNNHFLKLLPSNVNNSKKKSKIELSSTSKTELYEENELEHKQNLNNIQREDTLFSVPEYEISSKARELVDVDKEFEKKNKTCKKKVQEHVEETSNYMQNIKEKVLLQTKRSLYESDLAREIKKKKSEVLNELSLENVGGFDFDVTPSDLTKVIAGDSDEQPEEDLEEEELPKKKLTPAERKAAAFEAEKRLREKEEELLRADTNPQSADHFDRILLGEPNNSKRWIQYMAFHLQTADFDKARSVAKRALKTINVREEQEKLNVWIALLNLDHTYSHPEVFQETLTEALKFNDDYAINSRVLDMYADSGKAVEVEQLANNLVRKYRDKKDCWLHCQVALMTVGLVDKARKMLQRSLSSIQRKEHVTLLSRFALLENKHGFPEQSQSLFENLLTSYPQRVDLWNVYVDMLIKSNRIDLARNVLERIKSHKLPVRKMKSLYNKWVNFEEIYGTPKSVLAVKAAAEQYVNNVTSLSILNDDMKEEYNKSDVKKDHNDDDCIDDDVSSED